MQCAQNFEEGARPSRAGEKYTNVLTSKVFRFCNLLQVNFTSKKSLLS